MRMEIRAGQIYFAKTQLGKANYKRPILILHVYPSQNEVDICMFSTKFDLIESNDLTINELDPEFSKTGLKESSYLIFRSVKTLPLSHFLDAEYRGSVTGSIKNQIENWWGTPLK